MTGYDFHLEAETGLDEIWEYIAADSIAAADRVTADQALDSLVPSRINGVSQRVPFVPLPERQR